MKSLRRHLIIQVDRLSTICFALIFMLGISAPILFSEKLRNVPLPSDSTYFWVFTILFVFTVVSFTMMKFYISQLKKSFNNDL